MLGSVVKFDDPSLLIVEWKTLVYAVWRQQPTLPLIQTLGRQYQQHARRYPQGFYVMIIVEDGVPIPDGEQRIAIERAEKEAAMHIKAMVGVQEAKGFLGAAIRSAMLGMILATTTPYRRHICANVVEGADYMCRYMKDVKPNHIIDEIQGHRQKKAV
jgi:hypothetical protein